MSVDELTYDIKRDIVVGGLRCIFVGASVRDWADVYSPRSGRWSSGERDYLSEFVRWAERSAGQFVPFNPDIYLKRLEQVLGIMEGE